MGPGPNLSHVRVPPFSAGGSIFGLHVTQECCRYLALDHFVWGSILALAGSGGKNVAKIVRPKTVRGERGQGCSHRTSPPRSSFSESFNIWYFCNRDKV